ncbi:MAG: radical SAM protein, partial [Bacteroidetes bacterium]|nr:radical SAM protein [Bacteroidota bacterium]
FELSNACNLECEMCSPVFSSKHNKQGRFRQVYDNRFVDQLTEFIPNIVQARFFGGEPFLINIYFRIWEKIIELNPKCRITLQTNGTILNDKIKDLLNKGKFNIGISIDSLQKERYERIRKGADFEEVMKNIDYFTEYCHKKSSILNFSVCPMTINWEEIPDLVDFCNDRKALIYFNTVFQPEYLSFLSLGSNDLDRIITELKPKKFRTATIFEKKNSKHYFDFVNLLKVWFDKADERERENRHRTEKFKIFMEQVEEISKDELIARMVISLRNAVKGSNYFSKEDKAEISENLVKKMTAFFKSRPDNTEIKMVIYDITTSDKLPVKIVRLSNMDEEELSLKIKQYISRRKPE